MKFSLKNSIKVYFVKMSEGKLALEIFVSRRVKKLKITAIKNLNIKHQERRKIEVKFCRKISLIFLHLLHPYRSVISVSLKNLFNTRIQKNKRKKLFLTRHFYHTFNDAIKMFTNEDFLHHA
jgi:hypothetical protein